MKTEEDLKRFMFGPVDMDVTQFDWRKDHDVLDLLQSDNVIMDFILFNHVDLGFIQ